MYIFRYDEPQTSFPIVNLSYNHLRETCILQNPANYGGCLTVRKEWLMKINGYEQHEVFRTGGDHANGLDVYTRFKNLGLHIMWHPNLKLYHPWHPHKPGFQNAYKLQHVFIRYRAVNLDVLAFEGIDSRLNREIPSDLAAELEKSRDNLQNSFIKN